MITLEDIFEAYFACRKNKRQKISQLEFELDLEANLIHLHSEIIGGKYKIGKSICFVVDKPIPREVFAASFRDRIVHHLVFNKLNHIFEKNFIHDSFACRKGRGTLFGIKRVSRFVRSCTNNFTEQGYVLRLDIQGFFMSLDKQILYQKVFEMIWAEFLEGGLDKADFELLDKLVYQNIWHDPTSNFRRNSCMSKWKKIPSHKSLFTSSQNKGLPIGNLTSQIFANIYMNSFDHYVKSVLACKYYGRYVDDFVLIGRDKIVLLDFMRKIKDFLFQKLNLVLHPKKVYFQSVRKGFGYIGARLYLGYILPGKRLVGNFLSFVYGFLKSQKFDRRLVLAKFCSYFGFICWFKSYGFRGKLLFLLKNFDNAL